jgi:predicted DsbA family dithiol-disulfide isomerase
VNKPIEKSAAFQFSQGLGQHLPGNVRDGTLKDGLRTQNLVAERLFQAYFLNGEDVGDPATLLGIAREFGVTAILRVEDLDRPALVSEVKTAERKVGIRGVPQISFQGTIVANGALKEELLANSIRQILGTTGRCENGACTV